MRNSVCLCMQVQQSFVLTPLEQQMPALLTLLQQHMRQDPDYKVLLSVLILLLPRLPPQQWLLFA